MSIATGGGETPHQDLRVASYNLRENLAMGELNDLVAHHDVDVLCLQECDSNVIPEAIGDLQLAASTLTNRLGLALYYRTNRLAAVKTGVYALRKSLHDRVLVPAHERLLAARLVDRQDLSEIVIGSFHAAPLTASNRLRREQIDAAHECLHSLTSGVPTLLVGDYNYPWFQRHLRERLEKRGIDVTLAEGATYQRGRYFSGNFDFATSVGVDIEKVVTLPKAGSDHRPILLSVRPEQVAQAA